MLRRMGRFSARAAASASSPQGHQATGLCACCRRYGLVSVARWLATACDGLGSTGLRTPGRATMFWARPLSRANFIPLKSSLVPRDAAPRQPKIDRYAARLERLRPLRPWGGLLLLAVLVLGSAPFAIAPIRDAATFEAVAEATLRRPAGYVLLAPLSNVFDLLTLLSVRQHIALLV